MPSAPRRAARARAEVARRRADVPVVVWLGFAAFIGLGLPEATLGVTWPSIRAEMGRPLSSLGIVLGALTVGYLPSSAISGRVAARLGAGRALGMASATYAVGLALLVFAPSFPFVVAGSLLNGLAAGQIDPGLNAHFALRHGPRAMNLLHASFGIGATLGPTIATGVLGADGSWRLPYLLYAVIQLGLLGGFVVTRHRWAAPSAEPTPESRPHRAAAHSAGRTRLTIVLALVNFFIYTGLEVGAGVLAFTLLTESRGFSDTAGGIWAAGFWAGLTVGRVALGVAGHRLAAETTLRASVIGAMAASALIWIDVAGLGAAGFPLLGLMLAGIFPSLVLLTPRRVGADRTADVVGVQFALAGIGASAVPAAIGVLADGALERIGPSLFALAVTIAVLDVALARLHGGGASADR